MNLPTWFLRRRPSEYLKFAYSFSSSLIPAARSLPAHRRHHRRPHVSWKDCGLHVRVNFMLGLTAACVRGETSTADKLQKLAQADSQATSIEAVHARLHMKLCKHVCPFAQVQEQLAGLQRMRRIRELQYAISNLKHLQASRALASRAPAMCS